MQVTCQLKADKIVSCGYFFVHNGGQICFFWQKRRQKYIGLTYRFFLIRSNPDTQTNSSFSSFSNSSNKRFKPRMSLEI